LVAGSQPVSAVLVFSALPSNISTLSPLAGTYHTAPLHTETVKSPPFTFSRPSAPPGMPDASTLSDLSFSTRLRLSLSSTYSWPSCTNRPFGPFSTFSSR
jgi:hypothetical protein